MNRVAGKVAIVTGAASGLGKADAEALAAEGAHVIVSDIDATNGARVAEQIGATFVQHDATSEADWSNVIDIALSRFGKLDILVNNAGMAQTANIEACTLDDFRKVQRVNAESAFLGCRYGVLTMAKNAEGGSIINISSMAAIRGFPEVVAYSASKGAIRSLSTTVATHCLVAGYAIRCNTILPGSTLTPMQQQGEANRLHEKTIGMDRGRQRMGKPADIANLVVYLASDESVQITGQEFVVDGGYSIR